MSKMCRPRLKLSNITMSDDKVTVSLSSSRDTTPRHRRLFTTPSTSRSQITVIPIVDPNTHRNTSDDLSFTDAESSKCSPRLSYPNDIEDDILQQVATGSTQEQPISLPPDRWPTNEDSDGDGDKRVMSSDVTPESGIVTPVRQSILSNATSIERLTSELSPTESPNVEPDFDLDVDRHIGESVMSNRTGVAQQQASHQRRLLRQAHQAQYRAQLGISQAQRLGYPVHLAQHPFMAPWPVRMIRPGWEACYCENNSYYCN